MKPSEPTNDAEAEPEDPEADQVIRPLLPNFETLKAAMETLADVLQFTATERYTDAGQFSFDLCRAEQLNASHPWIRVFDGKTAEYRPKQACIIELAGPKTEPKMSSRFGYVFELEDRGSSLLYFQHSKRRALDEAELKGIVERCIELQGRWRKKAETGLKSSMVLKIESVGLNFRVVLHRWSSATSLALKMAELWGMEGETLIPLRNVIRDEKREA